MKSDGDGRKSATIMTTAGCGRDLALPTAPPRQKLKPKNISIIRLFCYFPPTSVDWWPGGSASVNKFTVF